MKKIDKTYVFDGYVFDCWYWQTSNAWGHEVALSLNGIGEVARAKVRYYNRTWERYAYQSTMYQALENYKKTRLDYFLANKKVELGLRKFVDGRWEEEPFKRGQKKQAVEEFAETDIAKKIKEIEERIHEGR